MTTPTQAQIEADEMRMLIQQLWHEGYEALTDETRNKAERFLESANRLTAAAEVDGICPTCGADGSKIVSDLRNAESAEREACALLVEGWMTQGGSPEIGKLIAAAIRARKT